MLARPCQKTSYVFAGVYAADYNPPIQATGAMIVADEPLPVLFAVGRRAAEGSLPTRQVVPRTGLTLRLSL